ncbi:DUF6461 domain-containing protein [Streptomyces radiopugnans]|nr:DUF6461 domain-containing protein [Streptomyces radiopugnans]
MSRATAREYRWLEEHFPELAEAYCLTAIRGLAVSTVLARLDAVRVCAVRGVDALYGPAYAAWSAFCGERLFAGVTAVDGWTLMVEPVGFLGVPRSVAEPLSRGTTVVSHSRTIEAADRFRWYQDGVERLSFEPLFPYRRGGSTPEVAVEQMRAVGFDLRAQHRAGHRPAHAGGVRARRAPHRGAGHPRTAGDGPVHRRSGRPAPSLTPTPQRVQAACSNPPSESGRRCPRGPLRRCVQAITPWPRQTPAHCRPRSSTGTRRAEWIWWYR